ncbi:hypothetical protein BGZ96_001196, partial [Linnemannia gamsii]
DGRRVGVPSDKDKDLPDPPRPNRRLNRDFRIIPPDEVETLTETQLQESIRQPPRKSSSRPPSVSLSQGVSSRTYQEPALQLNNVDEDDEESYFGDILGEYCNSDNDNDDDDDDLSSPRAPSSISTSDWRTSSNDQLPTPPSSRSSLLPVAPPPRRGAAGAGSGAAALAATLGQDSSIDSSRTRSRNNSAAGTSSSPSSSFTPSPVNLANAKFNLYLHAGPSRESHDSLLKLATPSSSPSQSPAPTTTRAYTKRPPPPPKDAVEPGHSLRVASVSTASSQQVSHSGLWNHNNDSLSDLKESRPEPPQKDSSRRVHHSNTNNNNTYTSSHRSSSQNTTSQPPQLSLDHHHHKSSGQHISSFADAVDATMNRHRAAPPVPGSHSGHSHSNDRTTTRERSSSHGHSGQSSSHHGQDRENSGGKPSYRRHESVGPGHKHEQHGHSQIQERSRSLPPQARPDQHQNHSKSSQQHNQQLALMQESLYRMQGQGSLSQLDVAGSGYKSTSIPPSASSRSSGQAPAYTGERTRAHSLASVSTNGSSGRYPPSSGLKSALLKTPIARARAKESKGPRKVIFGETITVVTIERTPTPPPVAPLDKKAKKKLLQSKKASSKDGKGQTQNFDPEYDAKYYDAPYTPTPAEVVITTAPWVGNPNWDEERQNSKFYYEDELDYEYDDDYEYEAPHESDIRLGPEDDEDDEDEDEDDDEEYQARPWGHGIAGPGGASPKKKGGMFKFKRAVNRLFLN